MDYKQLLSESFSKFVGLRQVLRGIENNVVRCVVIACDSESFVGQSVEEAIGAKCVKVLVGPTRKELGRLAGVDVGAAVVGLA